MIARLPAPVRRLVMRHHELIKFAMVGGTTFVFDMAIFYSLSLTVLEQKPVIAKVISGVLATILSYILNREWAFKNRGGRERHHEAMLFFAISGVGVILQAAPLFVANNVFDMRSNLTVSEVVVVDFVLGFVIGNLLQMAFRFWALRKFAFPEEQLRGGDAGSTDLHPSLAELNDEELGHA
ncbi:sugar translocase [Gordonia terrae]|uniref:Sugar translocase n=2 Tax=Gordonia terrae TaxID=2055 RepID=A0A2I1RD67_9ACTN|nr:sugar translocase [Gordonia terrae]